MGWLNKIFGGGATVDSLRKAVEQQRFAEARNLAEELQTQNWPEAETQEIARLQALAGDGLAQLNLDEALGLRRIGEQGRAAEHLQLALEQVCSDELRERIEAAAEEPLSPTVATPEKQPAGSCDSCGPQILEPLSNDDLDGLDPESRFDLILTSYPPQLAERYREKGDLFLQAFLLSHAGRDADALPLWRQVPTAEQDELFWFELGGAQIRSSDPAAGRQSLEMALQLNPGLLPASEVLVQLLVSLGETGAATDYLQDLLQRGLDPVFCQVQLTLVALQRKVPEDALNHARQAVAAGAMDSGFLQLTASLLEQAGELAEAEAILRQLPAGGCGGGGMSLPLAEFLLRQERELAKVLDAFNAACRQDPQNPRWQLRVAQTYLARGWSKEGLELLRKVAHHPQLDPELRQEAELLLSSHKS